MRLISQDGKIDIPYENSAVYILANAESTYFKFPTDEES
jgi:hypothetical protein